MGVEYFDDGWSVAGGYSIWSSASGYDDGEIFTENGIVSVCMQRGQRSEDFSALSILDFAYKGRVYRRTYNKRFTRRGIATKAKRFAREVVAALREGE